MISIRNGTIELVDFLDFSLKPARLVVKEIRKKSHKTYHSEKTDPDRLLFLFIFSEYERNIMEVIFS